MDEVIRLEKKYLLPYLQFRSLDGKLSRILHADENGQEDGYVVRSLYFDTLMDRDFTEKEDGIEVRRKIRLRIYGTDAEYAKLEMKQKQADAQKKRTLMIEKRNAIRLCEGDYECLLQEKDSFARELYGYMNMMCYRPKGIVEYKRKAYMAYENHTRITFDYELRATECSTELFSQQLNLYPVLDPNLVVMEVKYNNFLLSYIKDLVSMSDKSQVSVSKYCLSRAVGLHYLF